VQSFLCSNICIAPNPERSAVIKTHGGSEQKAYHIYLVSAQLVVRPGVEVPNWGAFISEHPPGSIALDGYVKGAPKFTQTPDGAYANVDHHEGVNRLATLSTAQQLLRYIRLGLADSLTQPNGDYEPWVFVNDCDQDISLAMYLIQNAPDIARARKAKYCAPLDNLVQMAGELDVSAGAYPYNPRGKLMKQIAWMFRPFTEFRDQGGVQHQNADEYRGVVGECMGRIGLHLAGRGGQVKLQTQYAVIGGGDRWKMFEELGAEGRIGAFHDGVKAYVIHKGQREDGMHDYTIGRASEMVPFDVTGAVALLNTVEECPPDAAWGCTGSGTVGGSPRLRGSSLGPADLQTILNTNIV
jgi:hypothetical protein